mmetsp:Transcript_38083/g.79813  ORF Transcript_38083/g.79813 Transcript_38083/m.79813 type:complete len:96 (+) Transcript_38083:56-343(+)
MMLCHYYLTCLFDFFCPFLPAMVRDFTLLALIFIVTWSERERERDVKGVRKTAEDLSSENDLAKLEIVKQTLKSQTKRQALALNAQKQIKTRTNN